LVDLAPLVLDHLPLFCDIAFHLLYHISNAEIPPAETSLVLSRRHGPGQDGSLVSVGMDMSNLSHFLYLVSETFGGAEAHLTH
jgi:hypothetical protein